MDKQKDIFTISEVLYYAFFTIMLVAKGFGLYQGQWPYTVVLVVSGLLIGAKLVTEEHTLAEWIIIVGLSGISLLSYYYSNEFGSMIIMATVLGMKKVSVKRVMTLGCGLWILSYSLSMLLALLGLRQDIFRVQDKLHLGYVIRWSLGQTHPNVLQISTILACAFILYVGQYKGTKLLRVTGWMFLLNLYIFLYSLSYTGFVLAILYLGMNLYLSYRDEQGLSVAEKIVAMLVIPGCALFSVLGPICFTGKLWDLCNKALNTRFNIAKQYMGLNPVSLWGSGYCNELPPELNNLDCSYVYALMHYGIVFFVLFIVAYEVLVWYCLKKGKLTELGIVLAMSVAAITEPFFVNPSFKNITWIFIGELLFMGTKLFGDRLPNSILTKKVGISPIGDRQVKIPVSMLLCKLQKYGSTIRNLGKQVVLCSLIMGIIAGGLFAAGKTMPAGYYMNRDTVQVHGEHGFLLDLENLPDDFAGEILEYTSPERLMMRIDGNAVTMEYVRGVLSMTLWVTLLIYLGLGYVMYRKELKYDSAHS